MAVADFQDKLLAGLGGAWPKPPDLNFRLREKTVKQGFTIESVYYDAETDDPIPALLLVPEGVLASATCGGRCCVASTCRTISLGKERAGGIGRQSDASYGSGISRRGLRGPLPRRNLF